ncbi:hypothetical protein KJ780_03835 [Candidatus Micrarchaeota archaeon]|nr:hypothetical protein [Candidatus Micrarchaeota archaeon]
MEIINIPVQRVSNLQDAKARLEELTNTKINISEEGQIILQGDSASEFFLKDVVKAIGRGFDPKDAEILFKDDYSLEIVDLKDVCRNEKDLQRVRGRVIGEEGKMKTEIENATDSKLCIYGWTVGVIAPLDTMVYALKAIDKIMRGSQLTTIFNDLARYKKEILANRLLGK